MPTYLLSIFTTAFGLSGIVLAALAILALVYLPRLAPYLAVAAAAAGALGYVHRLNEDLASANAERTAAISERDHAYGLARDNAKAAVDAQARTVTLARSADWLAAAQASGKTTFAQQRKSAAEGADAPLSPSMRAWLDGRSK